MLAYRNKNLIFLLLLQILWMQCFAQDGNYEFQEAIIEDFSEGNGTEYFEYHTGLNRLEEYSRRPLNLNKATYVELVEMELLSEIQIASLLGHIEAHGKLISIYELQAVPYWDLETIYILLPYVKVEAPELGGSVSGKDLLAGGDYNVFLRYSRILEKKKGYVSNSGNGQDAAYAGSPDKIYTRFRYRYGARFSYGITAEKDAGEAFFAKPNNQGFDFYSGHIYIRGNNWLKGAVAGDYSVRLGQGLILWSGFGFGKSSAVINIKKSGRKLAPYTSVNENNFLRGGAVSLGAGKWSFTLFGSRKPLDAGIVAEPDTIENEFAESVTSFIELGYHRTDSEIAAKDAVMHSTGGANISYSGARLRIGINAVGHYWDKSIQSKGSLYKLYNMTGNRLGNASIDYSYIIRNIHLFGETAVSDNGSIAALNGAMAALGKKADFAIMHRYYDKKYQSFLSNAFAESSKPQNEEGYYMALSLQPHKKWKLNAYADIFKFPWLKYRINSPSSGYEYLLNLTYTHSKKLEMYWRARNEVKQLNNSTGDNSIQVPSSLQKMNLRYQIAYYAHKSLLLRNRIEAVFYYHRGVKKEQGYMIYQDVIYRPLKYKFSIYLRYARFSTGSYDTRIYAYENDVLYSYSIPALYGHGSRYYLMVRYKFSKGIDVWLRFSQSYFNGEEQIGSGNETVDGNTRSEAKAQLRLRF